METSVWRMWLSLTGAIHDRRRDFRLTRILVRVKAGQGSFQVLESQTEARPITSTTRRADDLPLCANCT